MTHFAVHLKLTHLAMLGACFVWVFIAFFLSGRQDVPGSFCRFLIPDRGCLKIKKKSLVQTAATSFPVSQEPVHPL